MYNEQFLNKAITDLGYSDINSFAAQQIKLLLLSKIEEYTNLVKKYEKKYKMTYDKFSDKYLNKENIEDFDKEDDGSDWRFYTETLQMYNNDYNKLLNA